jgi:hypothetical protein
MTKYTDEELAARVKSPGWGLDGDTGTLEEVLKTAHQKRQDNELRGGIRELETAIELDMIQIEKLWLYLGLPV